MNKVIESINFLHVFQQLRTIVVAFPLLNNNVETAMNSTPLLVLQNNVKAVAKLSITTAYAM